MNFLNVLKNLLIYWSFRLYMSLVQEFLFSIYMTKFSWSYAFSFPLQLDPNERNTIQDQVLSGEFLFVNAIV